MPDELLKERIAGLSAEKRQILEQMLRQRGAAQSEAATFKPSSPILPRTTDQDLPLSFAQQRLWFLDQFVPGSTFYNIDNALRIKFPLNVEALERSYNEVVRRHESLRTTFRAVEGKPVQVIAESLTLPMNFCDLTSLPVAQREAEAVRMASEMTQLPFDLVDGPLVRTTLIKLGAADYLLLLGMHHIISDGWSMDLFAIEIGKLYAAYCLGQESPLPPLPIQYPDFALWQHQMLKSGVFETQLEYWKGQLADLPTLRLPTDKPRPAMVTYRGRRLPVEIPGPLYEKLKLLSQNKGVTLFMSLLGAFQVLLHRYSGQDDIVIGVPTANRNRAELENLIGFFVNTLVLRNDLAGNPSFSDLLARVRNMALAAYEHQDLPFERLVDELHPERDLSRNPLFQVCFQLFNVRSISETVFQPMTVPDGIAKFDLRLDLMAGRDSLKGFIEYSTDLFELSTIERISRHFLTLLESVVANPEARIGEIPLLDAAEHQLGVVEWNNTNSNYPRRCVHEVFETQVEQSPDAIAVSFDEDCLTYRDLNRRANRLAHHLRARGVRSEAPVGIFLERSIDMVVAQLGILKAGGAYVPLDPDYPTERLAHILSDVGASCLITRKEFHGRFPGHWVAVVDLEDVATADAIEDNPLGHGNIDSLAYVMYTSGSTGPPKGIAIPHRAITRLVCNTNYISLGPSDSIAQASNSAFDAATFEVWGALLNGGRLVGIPKDILVSPPELGPLLERQHITTMFVTTDLFNQIAEEAPDIFRNLRTLLVGGSAANPRWPREILARGRPGRLLHVYGPTECTTFASWYDIQEVPDRADTIPIGHPISSTELYVLDRHQNPVPVGVTGELHVGGDGLARGYLNCPDLTADRFVPNAFGRGAGERLYRTGDQARYRADGALEFLGRVDRQVKVRGFRIELGEIESTLRAHPLVTDAAVLSREDQPGDKRLAAYIVPCRGNDKSSNGHAADSFRAFLRERLPEYMIPASFVLMEALPLTPNGKVDLRALAPPETSRPATADVYAAPSTPAEAKLCQIWQQVLGVDRVGVKDNFFELGGDSILSIQVVARARAAGLKLTAKQFFQHQTIESLATVVETTAAAPADREELTGQVPLTPIQKWFFEHEPPEPHHFNQAVLLKTPPGLDEGILKRAFQELIAHHDSLRLRFSREEEEWKQFYAAATGEAPFTRHDLSQLSEAEQVVAIEKAATNAQRSLDLTVGPLVRIALFDLGYARGGRLLIVIHHLAVDGVSWRILMEDLWNGYAQISRGEAIRFPAKTTSFKRWAEHLWRASAAREEIPHWLAIGKLQPPGVPRDFNGSANLVVSSKTVSVSLTADETDVLLHAVPKAYQTQINDVLLTAFIQAFSKWTGQASLFLDLESHGRDALSDSLDVSRTIGWFTSIFPVRLHIEPAMPHGEALKSIKEQLRSVPNRGMGYGLLRYLGADVEIRRELEAQPQPELSFNYLGQISGAQAAAAPITLAPESTGPMRSPRQTRRHLIEINGSVLEGCLQVDWTFNEGIHRSSTVENLARDFVAALRSLMAHCQSPEAGGYTPSDFSKSKLSQAALDKLVAKVKQSRQ